MTMIKQGRRCERGVWWSVSCKHIFNYFWEERWQNQPTRLTYFKCLDSFSLFASNWWCMNTHIAHADMFNALFDHSQYKNKNVCWQLQCWEIKGKEGKPGWLQGQRIEVSHKLWPSVLLLSWLIQNLQFSLWWCPVVRLKEDSPISDLYAQHPYTDPQCKHSEYGYAHLELYLMYLKIFNHFVSL